jgi:hypothetical protein
MANLELEFTPSVLEDGALPESISEGDAVQFRQLSDDGGAVETPLFIRSHLIEKQRMLDAFMEHDINQKLYLSGPPGCGMTSFVTLWARMFAQTGKRVLLVFFREDEDCAVLQLDDKSVMRSAPSPTTDKLKEKVQRLIDLSETGVFDLCVFDGVRQQKDVCGNVLSLLNSRTGPGPSRKIKKVIYVTSFSFRLRGGDVRLGIGSVIERHSFDSWSLEDHVNSFIAFHEKGLLGSELVDDVKTRATAVAKMEDESDDDMDTGLSTAELEEYATYKYFYAGGSARFMFEYTLHDLKKELDILIPSVESDDWRMFSSSDVAAATPAAVNTLMQRFSTAGGMHHCVAVSKYVLIHAYEKCKGKLIDAVKAIAQVTGNPTLKGWAFELKQLELIDNILSSTVEQHANNSQGLVFTPSLKATYDGTLLDIDGVLASGTLISCLKWNQGCFDLAFYSNNILVTLQFTILDSHSLKLEHVKHFRDALVEFGNTVDNVVHIGIVPNRQALLKFKSPTGTGRSYCETEFTVRVCVASELQVCEGQGTELLLLEGEDVDVHNKKRRAPGPGLQY